MKNIKNKILLPLLIIAIVLVVIIGISLYLKDNTPSNDNPTASGDIIETEPNNDLTFSNNEEIYNYAVTQIEQKKYYNAIRYLRQIPGYKDADTLQISVYSYINNYNFTYSNEWSSLLDCEDMNSTALKSGIVLDRGIASTVKGRVVQCLSDGYIDESYVFHLIPPKDREPEYNKMYADLINYNQSVSIVKLESYFINYNTLSYFVLSHNNNLLHYGYDQTTNKSSFTDCTTDNLERNEVIVDINYNYALTNKGNIYQLILSDNHFSLKREPGLSNAIAMRYFHEINNTGLIVLTDKGTITHNVNTEFPAVSKWSDIISVDVADSFHQTGYCFGLTSSGTILVCAANSSVTETPFPSNQTFEAISSSGTYTLAALTDTGHVYIYNTNTKTLVSSVPDSESLSDSATLPQLDPNYNFTSDKVIYDYAVSQLAQRKYYSAVKFLRLIPNYKDASTLQMEAYKHINQEYFIYSISHRKYTYFDGMKLNNIQQSYVINVQEAVSFTGTVLQQLDYGFLDTDGNLYITRKDFNDNSNLKYVNLKKYNETTKFQQLTYNFILTKDGQVVVQGDANDSNPLTSFDDFTTLTSKDMLPNEKIIYICGITALSNLGNVYTCNSSYGTLTKNISLSNIISVQQYDYINVYITTEGTVICEDKTLYPDIKNWTNVISIEMNSFGCIGLTADGKILLATKDGTPRNSPFPDDVTFIAICGSNSSACAAISDTGALYIYEL